MAEQERAPGVCVIRVQVQASSLLITVLQTPDIASRRGETTASFTEVDDAVRAVRKFLERYPAR
ncbi:hypothetical protein [Actinoplanes solisilvae]|uniref:hypothetical protein n=1 Tax=Actinoplanes solisilvae TaxID=2486853 RepID=UPI000FDC0DF2|nr:hypothetical protein [Actinoplanes solisilvae]